MNNINLNTVNSWVSEHTTNFFKYKPKDFNGKCNNFLRWLNYQQSQPSRDEQVKQLMDCRYQHYSPLHATDAAKYWTRLTESDFSPITKNHEKHLFMKLFKHTWGELDSDKQANLHQWKITQDTKLSGLPRRIKALALNCFGGLLILLSEKVGALYKRVFGRQLDLCYLEPRPTPLDEPLKEHLELCRFLETRDFWLSEVYQ